MPKLFSALDLVFLCRGWGCYLHDSFISIIHSIDLWHMSKWSDFMAPILLQWKTVLKYVYPQKWTCTPKWKHPGVHVPPNRNMSGHADIATSLAYVRLVSLSIQTKSCVLNNFNTLWDILIIFGRHLYQIKTVCHMQEWLLSPACLLSYLPWKNFKWKACALNNSYTLWDILLIFGIHIYQVKMVCHMLEWLPPLAVLLSYLPSTNLTGESLCAQWIKTRLRYINDNW